jgi:SH3-like domain-containing protein
MAMSFALRTAAFLCLFFSAISDAANVVVVKDIAKVLLLPYGDAKQIGLVKKGDQFKVITKKNDWYNIEFRNTIGWIFQDNVRADVKPETKTGTAERETSPPSVAAVPKPVAPPPPVAAAPKPAAPPPSIAAANIPATPPAPPPQVRQQNSPEIKKPQERPDQLTEKTESRQKKPLPRQKKPQVFPVDLPPVAVMPSDGEKEKTLPVQDETGAGGTVRAPVPALPPQALSSTGTALQPDVSNLPQVKSAPAAKNPHPASRETVTAPVQPAPVNGEEVKKYLEITGTSVKVLASVSPESPIIGIAHKNDCYVLLFEGQSWCKIRFDNAEGWVERREGRVVDSPTMAGSIPRIVLFSAVGLGILIVIVFSIIFLTIRLRTKAARKVAIRKDLLIIAHSEKEISLSLTDSTTTLSKCFSEIGFKVNYASEMDHARNMLMHYLPDVIVVDWHLGANVMHDVESVLSNRTSTTNILVIFYNVPDVSSVPQSKVIPNAHFLGISVSDREIFRLVTPLIMTQSETKSIRRSVESSALGGELGHGSLIEVMQFIEIGRKTGCLYIVIEKPFGLIYFEQGRLTYAASQAKQGRDAVFEILALKTGHFHFVLDKVSPTKNVNLSTLEILMEWTKTVDEAHRI